MKLVIQNSCRHTLTRKELEAMIKLFPSAWTSNVEIIAFYGSSEQKLKTEYYPKEKILGLFWPHKSNDKKENMKAIEELLVSLQCISENGNLSSMQKSKRNYYTDKTAEIREQCICLMT
jgi:hypothetical protein